jgi:hypothetical protein
MKRLGVVNFAIGIVFFFVGGWLGQFSFAMASIYTLADMLHSLELRRIPFYTSPINWAYGMSWRTATFIQCEAAAPTCTGSVPLAVVSQFGLAILAISVVESFWFYRLVRASVRKG